MARRRKPPKDGRVRAATFAAMADPDPASNHEGLTLTKCGCEWRWWVPHHKVGSYHWICRQRMKAVGDSGQRPVPQ